MSDDEHPAELARRVRRMEDEISDLRERVRRIERNIDPGATNPLPGAFEGPPPNRHSGEHHPPVVTPGSAEQSKPGAAAAAMEIQSRPPHPDDPPNQWLHPPSS
jgi:hypothetical protein